MRAVHHNPGRRDHRDGAARRVALDVDRDRVHRDVGRGDLDMDSEGRAVAAEPLRSDAEAVDGIAELGFERRALGIGAARAQGAGRRDLGEMHAEIGGAADADAHYGRRADLAAGLDDAVDDEGLHPADAVGGNAHLEERSVLRAASLGDHLDAQRLLAVVEIDIDDRDKAAAGGLLVLAGDRMDDGRAQRMLLRRAHAAAADRRLERRAVELDVATDDDVVDRNAGVLAEQVVGALGDHDVLAHRRQDGAGGGVALALRQFGEAELDVVGQDLERPDIEQLRGFLDDVQIDVEGHRCIPHLRTV